MIDTTTIRFAPAAAPARWTFRAEAVKNGDGVAPHHLRHF
jgi:hypothetical protein